MKVFVELWKDNQVVGCGCNLTDIPADKAIIASERKAVNDFRFKEELEPDFKVIKYCSKLEKVRADELYTLDFGIYGLRLSYKNLFAKLQPYPFYTNTEFVNILMLKSKVPQNVKIEDITFYKFKITETETIYLKPNYTLQTLKINNCIQCKQALNKKGGYSIFAVCDKCKLEAEGDEPNGNEPNKPKKP